MAAQTQELQWLFSSNAAMEENQYSTSLSDQRSNPHEGTVISYPSFGSLSVFWISSKVLILLESKYTATLLLYLTKTSTQLFEYY